MYIYALVTKLAWLQSSFKNFCSISAFVVYMCLYCRLSVRLKGQATTGVLVYICSVAPGSGAREVTSFSKSQQAT